MKNIFCFCGLWVMAAGCRPPETPASVLRELQSLEALHGDKDYLSTPYVTAGDRVYMVGNQDGSFPDHGWHVAGEMGGVWNHPIKLMDGFYADVEGTGSGKSIRPDGAAAFTNYPVGNVLSFEIPAYDLAVQRAQFAPDGIEGLVVEYTVSNRGSEPIDFLFRFHAMIDLMPVWLSERLGIKNETDQVIFDNRNRTLIGKDEGNEWYVVIGSEPAADRYFIGRGENAPTRKGKGENATLVHHVRLEPSESEVLKYFIAGSYLSKQGALSAYEQIKTNHLAELRRKISRYQKLKATADISIPDEQLETMYRWTKYNTDWLIRDVDTLGRGLSAGMADYPWWFGADNCYAMQGLLATGQHEEVKATIALLAKLTERANGRSGRIIHEASTNGVVYNPGNLNETPHFVHLLWQVFEWTGDERWLARYYDLAKSGMAWILSQDKDGNLFADGPGMMEIPGLHTEMIDVVVYTQQGAEALAKMARRMGEESVALTYEETARQLKDRINTEWWSQESRSYADFRADPKETKSLIEAAMVRSDTLDRPQAVAELAERLASVERQKAGVQSQVVYHNWVVNTPMEAGIADREKALQALATARRYTSRYGSYVTGLDRDESQDASSKWEVFSYVGAVMTLPTGVQAIAEGNYGNADEAWKYMERLTRSFGYALPGSTYEVSPDYGMMTQAWNIYAVAVPIVTRFFGFRPEAQHKRMHIKPEMPSHWREASIRRVVAGDNFFSLTKKTDGNKVSYEISQTGNWQITVGLPEDASAVTVNGKAWDSRPVAFDDKAARVRFSVVHEKE